MCLIGGAGSVAQSFTGSGVFKGHNNVASLVAMLDDAADLDGKLVLWDAT